MPQYYEHGVSRCQSNLHSDRLFVKKLLSIAGIEKAIGLDRTGFNKNSYTLARGQSQFVYSRKTSQSTTSLVASLLDFPELAKWLAI